MSDAEETTPGQLMYVGERMNPKGQRRYAYVTVDGESVDDEEKWYARPLIPALPLGSILNVTYSDDSVLMSGDDVPRFDRSVKIVGAKWHARHAAARTMIDAAARARRAKASDRGLGQFTLDELAHEYRRQHTGPRSNALLAASIGYVTSTRLADTDSSVES